MVWRFMLRQCLRNWALEIWKALKEEPLLFLAVTLFHFLTFLVLATLLPATIIGFLLLGILTSLSSGLLFIATFSLPVYNTTGCFLIPTWKVWFNGKRVPWAVLYLVLLRHRKEVEILSLAWLLKPKKKEGRMVWRYSMIFLELVKRYKEAMEQTRKIGEEIGRALCEALKPLVSSISFTVGEKEFGGNVICLYCEHRDVLAFRFRLGVEPGELSERAVSLKRLLKEELPELADIVETPFGIYFLPEEAEQVKAALRSLRSGSE